MFYVQLAMHVFFFFFLICLHWKKTEQRMSLANTECVGSLVASLACWRASILSASQGARHENAANRLDGGQAPRF
jgi:hypothetical protein